eukprot:1723373-Rhodomonas_salina.4
MRYNALVRGGKAQFRSASPSLPLSLLVPAPAPRCSPLARSRSLSSSQEAVVAVQGRIHPGEPV